MSIVLIRGDGIAAHCSAYLLARAGLRPVLEAPDRPKIPAIMLSETTQKLLQDIFERADLFRGLPRIRKRIVDWGANARRLVLPHSAVVVSEPALLNRIRQAPPSSDGNHLERADWTIFTSRPLPANSTERHFGSRHATASAVKLKDGSDSEACWVESVDEGWLFLLPDGAGKGWLLSVGGSSESLLAASRTVAEQIAETDVSRGEFPSHPRISDPLCEAGWLACGTAALGFDPLCGDGAGHAAREAILGSAVIRAVASGADATPLVEHYKARLLAGFNRHLEVCQEFYRAGSRGPWWDQELYALQRGLDWCGSRLAAAPAFRYRLNGFVLEALA